MQLTLRAAHFALLEEGTSEQDTRAGPVVWGIGVTPSLLMGPTGRIDIAVAGQLGGEPPALLCCHARSAPMDAPQSIGDSHVGQSASSSVMTDSQCEHRSAGWGSDSKTAVARAAGVMAEVSFIGRCFPRIGESVESTMHGFEPLRTGRKSQLGAPGGIPGFESWCTRSAASGSELREPLRDMGEPPAPFVVVASSARLGARTACRGDERYRDDERRTWHPLRISAHRPRTASIADGPARAGSGRRGACSCGRHRGADRVAGPLPSRRRRGRRRGPGGRVEPSSSR